MQQDATTTLRSRSFGAVADEYDRLRPAPPSDVLAWLVPEGAREVLELGAGTGILTRLLAARGLHVTACEPDSRMRAVLDAATHGVVVLDGRAERIPVPDASVDLVAAQSAWHWVDESLAVPEVARVLRPGGRLALAWTGTDRTVDWMRTLWAGGIKLSAEQSTELDAFRGRRHVVRPDAAGEDPFVEPETKLFEWTRMMTKSDLVALAATYSAVITLEESARRERLEAMSRYLDRLDQFAVHDVIEVPMRSYCWRASLR